MGGGDLNMKKHFHPLTMENLERVWKAEEKKRLEEEKVAQLQSELQEERRREELQRQAVQSGLVKKKTEKLDWMYSHQTVNTEEYLLGRKIDKQVEVMKEDKPTLATGEGVKKPEKMQVPNTKELMLKISEDPLFLIKKQEEENRKQLAQNPIKMKKLKELLEVQMKQKRKKEKKKKRKKEKKRHQSESEDESKEMKKRPHAHLGHSMKKKRRHNSENSDSDDSDDENRKGRSKVAEHHSKSSSSRNHEHRSNSVKKLKHQHDTLDEGEHPSKRVRRKSHNPSDTDSDFNKQPSRKKRERHSLPSYKGSDEDTKRHKSSGVRTAHHKNHTSEPSFERQRKRVQPKKVLAHDSSSESDDESEITHERHKHRHTKQVNGHAQQPSHKYEGKDRNYGLLENRHTKEDSDSDSDADGSSRNIPRSTISAVEFKSSSASSRRKRSNSSSEEEHKFSKKNAHRSRHDSSSSDENSGKVLKSSKPRRKADTSSEDEKSHRHAAKSKAYYRKHDSDSDSSPNTKMRHENNKFRLGRTKSGGSSEKHQHKNDRAVRDLDEDEMERKRQEMMGNAKWREEQRGANVKRYKEQDAKEESSVQTMLNKTGREDKARFIKKMQHESYSSSHTASVEDRIKRNINSKQRTKAALDKKFTAK